MKLKNFGFCIAFIGVLLFAAPVYSARQADSKGLAPVVISVGVLSSEGAPVMGLVPADFQLEVDGRQLKPRQALEEQPQELILVFDRLSLEKRSLKRVLKDVQSFWKTGLSPKTRVMVVLGGASLDILQKPTADTGLLSAALEKVRDAELLGDKYRGMKRSLIRSVSSAQTYQSGALKPSAGNSSGAGLGAMADAFGSMQTQQFTDQVNHLRDQEMSRILQALVNIETLVRGTAGKSTRRDIVWIGEDLFAVPGMDAYYALYDQFQAFKTSTNLKLPDKWAEEKNLRSQFGTISALAQGMEASLSVLDVADRNRYAGDRVNNNRRSVESNKFQDGDPKNMVIHQTGAQSQDLVWGGKVLAERSGGIFFYGSRDNGPFFEKLKGLTLGSYQLAFEIRELDGALHDFSASTAGATVYFPKKFAAAHPLSRLIDLANAEAILGLGENETGFELIPGNSITAEDGRVTQTFQIVLPVDRVQFAEDGDFRTAHLAIAVEMPEKDGSLKAPKVFEIPVKVEASRLESAKKVASSFRLLVDDRLGKIIFAVRDELSGRCGSMTLDLSK